MSDPLNELEVIKKQLNELSNRMDKLELALSVRIQPLPTKTVPTATASAMTQPTDFPGPSGIASSSTTQRPIPAQTMAAAPKTQSQHSVKQTAKFGDVESKIGAQWLNRVGVAALLTGAAYFLKLAFDNNWIGPSGRVAIGMICGIALVFWASKIHARGQKYFSYSLSAVGIGCMYLSLWAAFQLYHLVPAAVAFLAMIVVTASAISLAMKQDAQILAAVAIIGGFATPSLLSTGQNHPHVLFPYLALLDVSAIVLVAFKPWRRLLAACFIGTLFYYFGWLDEFYTFDQLHVALAYATLFFLLFAILPVIKQFNQDYGRQPGWADSRTYLFVALINPCVYFLEVAISYRDIEHHYDVLAWIAVAVGAFYIFLSRQSLEPKTGVFTEKDRRVHILLHLGLAVSFLTIAIPLKLNGFWITYGWLAESASLLYLSKRVNNRFLKTMAVIALCLAVFRLLIVDYYTTEYLVFNLRFIAYLFAVVLLGATAHFIRKESSESNQGYLFATVALNVLALIGLGHEVSDLVFRLYKEAGPAGTLYYPRWHDMNTARDFSFSILAMVYGAVLMAYGFLSNVTALRWQALILIALTIVKVFLYDLHNIEGPLRVLCFIGLGILLMGVSYVYQKDWLKLSKK